MSEETAEKAVLYIDTREKKLQPHIKSEYIEKQLDLGDIFIDSPSYKLMIERKTIYDFNASLRDGRYRNQKLRLIEWRDTDILMKKVIYILETNGDAKDSAYWGAVVNDEHGGWRHSHLRCKSTVGHLHAHLTVHRYEVLRLGEREHHL